MSRIANEPRPKTANQRVNLGALSNDFTAPPIPPGLVQIFCCLFALLLELVLVLDKIAQRVPTPGGVPSSPSVLAVARHPALSQARPVVGTREGERNNVTFWVVCSFGTWDDRLGVA